MGWKFGSSNEVVVNVDGCIGGKLEGSDDNVIAGSVVISGKVEL